MIDSPPGPGLPDKEIMNLKLSGLNIGITLIYILIYQYVNIQNNHKPGNKGGKSLKRGACFVNAIYECNMNNNIEISLLQ